MARRARAVALPAGSYLEWSPVIAGALGAAAISFLLLTFGASVGLTLTSPWSSGKALWAAVIGVTWWSVMVQIGSFFVGGYLAGRMRSSWRDADLAESRFRDSTHGFMVWAIGVLMGAGLLALTAGTGVGLAAKTAATAASGNANALSTTPIDYAVDSLMRNTRSASAPTQLGVAAPPAPATPSGNETALRDEMRRIFTVTVKDRELSQRDRDYLTSTVASRTGLSQADAQSRVDASMVQVGELETKAKQAADQARKASLIAGFITVASLLISLAAAVGGGRLGGAHRDEGAEAHLFGQRFW
ncbi:MAG: hypothetical protein JOZ70_09665 [Pseudolabrys sp.]|nr:hypothetical protein [Pseudolabrys sp.]